MIPVYKLDRLPPGQRRRKIVMMLSGIEQKMSRGQPYIFNDDFSEETVRSLIKLVLEDPSLEERVCDELKELLSPESGLMDIPRIVNTARHGLLTVTGTLPAEWDLILPGSDGNIAASRFYYPGISVYVEDIRSPFNLGSIFRSAEAFGVEKMYISPLCVSPNHQRAQRSAMGCTNYIPWEVVEIDNVAQNVPVFALETGGTPITHFKFPENGIVVLGSEELGISPEMLKKCNYGRVSIPMHGIKASINVGVAFGILMQYWSNYLADS